MIIAFETWKAALRADELGRSEESGGLFSNAAAQFYESGSRNKSLSKAYFEYSTLMDAFSNVQRARAKKKINADYEGSLDLFARSSEILRATLHFGFLSSYISACATLEEAHTFDSADDDLFQAYRNAIALLEQAKIALSLRDERHPLMGNIEALLKYSIGKALEAEGDILSLRGEIRDAKQKYAQLKILKKEYSYLAQLTGMREGEIPFFPVDDVRRVFEGSYIMTYPDADYLWILNVGMNPALVEGLGAHRIERRVQAADSFPLPLMDLPKGKIRVSYRDVLTGKRYDEGCLFLI